MDALPAGTEFITNYETITNQTEEIMKYIPFLNRLGQILFYKGRVGVIFRM